MKYRADPTGSLLALNHSVGGAATVGLSAGVFDDLADLCSTLQTALQVTDGSLRCWEVDGKVTFIDMSGDDFAITWTHPRLRDWLGFDGNLTGASSYTGTAPPGTVVAQHRWSSAEPLGWCWYTRQVIGDHQTGGSVKLSKVTKWRVGLLLGPDDLSAFRSVISFALRGYSLRWWRDVDVASAWSYSNWWGYLDVRLDPEWRSYTDDWHDPVTQLQLRATLDLMVEP